MGKKKAADSVEPVEAERTREMPAPRKTKRPKAPSKPPPWTFPKNGLEEAIAIAKAIEDKNGGNPIKADLLAKAVGFQSAK